MCAMSLLSACRVCLASDREMYRLANTALEETYERVTSGTLVVEGRPCCVCGVCLSALRRCRRFIDTAREANDALDRWIRNQPDTDTLKLTERPLFSFTRRDTELIEITSNGIWESRVKQESDTAESEDDIIIYQQNSGTSDDKDNSLTGNIKYEVTRDAGSDYTHVSGDDSDETFVSDNTESHRSETDEMIEVEMDSKIYLTNYVKPDKLKMLDNDRGDTAPGTSNVQKKHPTISLEGSSFQRFYISQLNKDTTSGPALQKHTSITLEHRPGNTKHPAAALHNEEIFLCYKCSYKTPKQKLYREHLKRHNGVKTVLCDKCDYRCLYLSELERHKCIGNSNYIPRKRRYYPRKRYPAVSTGEKPFACELCDYKSDIKGNLRHHMMRHTGEKPFACDYCDYRSRVKTTLVQHLMLHTGEKPLTCELCDFKCRERLSLKHHIMTHTGEKPYSCHVCDFKTRYSKNMKRHLLVHTGEKPFECDKCDYRCNEKFKLKSHLLSHTGEKPYLCDKCDYNCTEKRTLYRHIKNVHAGSSYVPKHRLVSKKSLV